jgi:two-component system OmpR family response regulator
VRVLVAEDEVRIAAPLKRSLEDEGYPVDIATTGPDTLWYASEFSYDAVLLDQTLPGMSGIEVCRRLRSEKQWMPILLLSSSDAATDQATGMDAGADDYLVKPFAFDELTARVQALIQRGGSEYPSELRVADLRLSRTSRQAWRGTYPLDLTSREFALLRLFMNHPGVVFSRGEILERVWDYQHDQASNVVDQYVSYLRRKIDRPFGVTQLITARGRGYQLRPYPIDG